MRIKEAIELLKQAKKPYIIAGGGIHYSEAWDELENFVEQFGIPVGETHAGRGSIRNASDILLGGTGHLGTPSAAKIAEEADLVLCIGTRLHDFVTGSNSAFQNPNVKFISINVNGRDAYKLGALPITADAKLSLEALQQEGAKEGIQPQREWVFKAKYEKESWENLKLKEVFTQYREEKMSQGHLIGILNDEMDESDILVAAAGTIPADLTKLFDVSGGKQLHLEFGNSCMGYDIPAAIGVRLTVTAIQERAKITILLNVNFGYQSIHGHQKALVGYSLGNEFKIRDPESRLLDEGTFIEIDYAKNAESIGLKTWVAHNESELRSAIQKAKQEENSCMIVVPTEKYRSPPGSDVWWEVVGAEVTNDPKTRELVESREAGRAKQRFYY